MRPARFGVLSRGILRIPALANLAGAQIVALNGLRAPRDVDAIAGWGRRPSSARARAYAARHGLPYLALEDGFLRSVGLGGEEPPLSLVSDDIGIYYDASGPSRLEALVLEDLDADELARARRLVEAWRAGRVSKYNALRDQQGELPARYVLVLDQTRGDASVTHGMADERSFARMLEAARDENPGCTVLVKVHPDVFAGKAQGYLRLPRQAAQGRWLTLAANVHLASLLEHAERVYAVTSQAGFEALLWGRPVRTFGMPFYAGWGLSGDELAAPLRRRNVTLGQLASAALLRYPRYVDPDNGVPCEAERVLEHLALQRRMHARFPPTLYAPGFSWWKRPIVRDFLRGSELRFVRRGARIAPGASVAVWGRSAVASEEGAGTTIRMEDGFLRSVGLGADLVRPLSWVMDTRGIYYDATRPSGLEQLLQTWPFDAALRARAAALAQRIVATGLSKYNVGAGQWQRPVCAGRVVLAVGQVESDAAMALGAVGVNTNAAFLAAVRARCPEDYLVYKPHPDLVAGLRRGGGLEAALAQHCDAVAPDAPIQALLEGVDEVHVISSLAGFEALLRGRTVVCHGQPFYAGWGLTTDLHPPPRRSRRLCLEELVAATLILYPTYIEPRGRHFIFPERALDLLLEWRQRGGGRRSPWRRLLRLALRVRARIAG